MAEKTHWNWPTTHPTLPVQQVHLWRASLNAPPAQIDFYRTLLSNDELDRAQRFVFERDQRRYVVGRGILRILLSAYLGLTPRAILFGYGPQGKPFVKGPTAARALAFNLSHSDEMAVVALAQTSRIGVDIEQHRPLDDMHQLAASVFSPRELKIFCSLPNQQQQQAFYACWTRKEAFIKAIGEGLTYPLARFDVSLAPEEPARVLGVQDDPNGRECWQMAAFSPRSDYSGAVVVEGQGFELVFWRFALGQFRLTIHSTARVPIHP